MPAISEMFGSRVRPAGAEISATTNSGVSRSSRRQDGFTLVEMVATMALASIIMVMAVGGYRYFSANRALDVAEREVITQIRKGQAMAVSTGNTHRIYFNVDDSTFVLQRRQGSEWVNADPVEELPTAVFFDATDPPYFGNDVYIEFYARGTSESGDLVLQNRNSQRTVISVDGETVNVTITGQG